MYCLIIFKLFLCQKPKKMELCSAGFCQKIEYLAKKIPLLNIKMLIYQFSYFYDFHQIDPLAVKWHIYTTVHW